VVTPTGGPRFIVRDGETGFVCSDDEFAGIVASILRQPERLAAMRRNAREQALHYSWDAVFDRIYAAYRPLLCETAGAGASSNPG
jgi:glycosyltransferase involved in cell wall biosynthesis